MIDLSKSDLWAECIQTTPNPHKPSSVYAVSGAELLSLPMGEGSPKLLGTMSTDGEVHVCCLHHLLPAILVVSMDQFSPEVIKRLAGESWLLGTYGPGWWTYPQRRRLEDDLWLQASRQGDLIWDIAKIRAAYPVETVEENFVNVFEPSLGTDREELELETPLKPVSFCDLMNMDFPEPQYLVKPWLRSPGLAMIFAERGVGKSLFACSLAHALTTGREFMVWN